MTRVDVCSGCGKLIDGSFFYCPWCGKSRFSQKNESCAEMHFNFEQKKMEMAELSKLEKMNEELDNLEKELSVLVLSAEMSK